MTTRRDFDVIIIGGSYSGLAAGMALGRALKKVLIIDSGKPCNSQTPYSHNFITQDGKTPNEIAVLAKRQVQNYDTIMLLDGLATDGTKNKKGFQIHTTSGETFNAKKLIFATGVTDIMQDIHGYAQCWGISVLHCPYCHGYEVRGEKTGILGNGESGFELSALVSNWTKDLTLFTNGKSSLTTEQTLKLKRNDIKIIETKIKKLEHINGQLQKVIFNDATTASIKAMYARSAFDQHCTIPEKLGCELTQEGYIKVDAFQKTTVPGIFACGDNTLRMRAIANAVSTGTTAGIAVNKEIVFEEF
jgi:thioredoxin reductase